MKISAEPQTTDAVSGTQTNKAPKVDKEKIKKEREKLLKQRNKLLRELREEVRDLADFVGKVKLGLTSIEAGATYIKKTMEDIQALFVEIEKINSISRSDTVRHITNLWEQLQANPVLVAPEQPLPQQDQLHALSLLEDRVAKIVLAVGHLTIPHRLNRWLDQARTGYYVPFHQLFEDELPDQADRLEVFRNIALAPKMLNSGVICGNSGLVYRYEPNSLLRYFSLFLVLSFFGALTYAIWSIGKNSLPLVSNFLVLDTVIGGLLLPSWFAILVGITVHIAVSGVKKSRESGLPPVIAVREWMLIFSARKGEILLKLMLALIGLFSMVFLLGESQITISSAFFVGYSLDSFIGLFGESMDKKAASQLSTFRTTLGLKTDG